MTAKGALPPSVAVLDARVLFQGGLTNLLLHLAEAKAFEPTWSDEIHAEWMRDLLAAMGIPLDKIEYRRGQMEDAFPAANVPASPAPAAAIERMSRTAGRRKDAHIVATAVMAKAGVIVTHNIKDFAPHVLSYYGNAKVRPDSFCVGLLASLETQVLAGIRRHRVSLRKTPMSPDQYIGHLANERVGMPRLAVALAPYGAFV